MTCEPLFGARWDGEATSFAVFSSVARRIELALPNGRVSLEREARGVWTARAPAPPGTAYAYHVEGPRGAVGFSRPLIDPYARAVQGDVAAGQGRALVVEPSFPWGEDRPPRIPWRDTLIYECHVGALTARHPEVPPELRGTYLGLACEPVIQHLRRLGVTAVELLPVHHALPEAHLRARGRQNVWGYSTLSYFAPDPRYATGDDGRQVREFQTMVRTLHAAGIEVLLDVVYNHTCEGGPDDPAFSFRGFDEEAYYLFDPSQPGRYYDVTGCGNTFAVAHPRGLQLVMDSLRYWVEVLHVDGFRFDLAPALARDPRRPGGWGRFFDVVLQDPLLSTVKLIAEPWDLGPGGYRLGRFPAGWAEWNDRYRDGLRRFWRGDEGLLGEVATRIFGSSDVFGADTLRGPLASVNYVACHDGFTLADLASYERKHNEANGEDNRDGTDANWSIHWGVEGPTRDPEVLARRARHQRNLIASLAFSLGVPMLNMGDELGRSQRGNNNPYCLDDETTWVDWALDTRRAALLEFARRAFALRREHPALRSARFLAPEELRWFGPDGAPLEEGDWQDPARKSVLAHLKASGEELLLLLHAERTERAFALPLGRWKVRLDTWEDDLEPSLVEGSLLRPGPSLLLLERAKEDAGADG